MAALHMSHLMLRAMHGAPAVTVGVMRAADQVGPLVLQDRARAAAKHGKFNALWLEGGVFHASTVIAGCRCLHGQHEERKVDSCASGAQRAICSADVLYIVAPS